MKRIAIATLLMAACMQAGAQAMSHGKWEENSYSKVKVRPVVVNLFTQTEMSEADKVVTFAGLPVIKGQAWAVVSAVGGEVISRQKIDPQHNTMDLSRLSSGEMYFITLMYRDRSQKGFVLHL